jgi:hypothetical protein
VCLGNLIGGGELKINPKNMEIIIGWLVPTNFIEFRIFVGESRYMWNFISSSSMVVVPIHAITTSGNNF